MSSEATTTTTTPVQRYHLVWLDENIASRANQKTLSRFADVDGAIRAFDRTEECLNYVQHYKKKGGQLPIIFIISGALSEENVPRFHGFPWITGIFIYCRNPRRLEHLKFSKLRDILDDTEELMDRLKYYVERDQVSMDYHFFTERKPIGADQPLGNLKEEQTRFLWFYKWYQFMIDLQVTDTDDEAKAEMIRFCREKFDNKPSEARVIEQFEKEECEKNAANAIHWYTRSAFMFRWINEALVRGDITQIYRFRYLIRLICQQLKTLDGNYRRLSDKSVLRLYRGAALKLSQIEEMSQHIGDLICINSFLSTSADESVAINFSRTRRDDGLESVLFHIDVDLDNSPNIAMADIRHFSKFTDEEEVLFSIGAIFSIQSVERDNKEDLYIVHLVLGNREQLTVNKYLEETYKNDAALCDRAILFGKLLFDMNEWLLAIEHLQKCVSNLSDEDNHKRPIYLNNIGVCYNESGDKRQALIYYKQALRIYERNPGDKTEKSYYQNELGACYHNIASYFFSQKDYSSAYGMAIDALSKRQNFPLGKASTFDLLGSIQLINHDNDAARESFRQSLQLRLKYLSPNNPNHPDIAVSYENMARLCFQVAFYKEAKEHFQRALAIYRNNFSETHPRVVAIKKHLARLNALTANE